MEDNELLTLILSPEGRVNRAKWWAVGFSTLAVIYGAAILALTLDGAVGWILFVVVYVLLAWANIVVTIKRWHDRDKSGWFYLVVFIPIIGGLWVLIECGFLAGTLGANRFGPDPIDG